jgi:DNA-binding SARP family transcriptional activator
MGARHTEGTVARTTTVAPTSRDTRRTPARAHLVIRLLGEVEAEVDGRPVPALTAQRMMRLVARLTLARGTGVPREQLAHELWPDSGAAQARTNLRKLLHDLRRSLPGSPELVDTGGRAVRWRAGSPALVDVVRFTEALARGDPVGAMSSYGGDLLPSCDDDWVVAERERLRRLAIEALWSLATSAEAAGHDPDVVEQTRRLLQIDALHEPACRLLMQALARRGERGEALRSYERLRASLRRDLGVGPEPVTTALAEQLRRADRDTGAGHGLVGRSTEWRTARRAWHEAAAGRAGVLCVAGEAGVGKSRLVEELARTVAADGHAVAYSRAYEAAGRPPWGSVIDWLRAEPVQSRLDTLDDVCLTQLARLLPELRMVHPVLPDAPPTTDFGRRHHLLDAVRRGLLAVGRPLLLVLDDLQWCDADTVELCQLLVQSASSAPVLVACTVRDEDAAGALLLGRMRRRLALAGAATVIALGPLDRRATAEMAALVGSRALAPEAATRLWAETDGNPLFIVEAMRSGFGARAPAPVALTATVHALITSRLDRVSPTARGIAEIAATIGREFTAPVLAAAAGRSEDELVDDLDELWRLHIVRARGSAYDFSHDRLRDRARRHASPPQLAALRLHGRRARGDDGGVGQHVARTRGAGRARRARTGRAGFVGVHARRSARDADTGRHAAADRAGAARAVRHLGPCCRGKPGRFRVVGGGSAHRHLRLGAVQRRMGHGAARGARGAEGHGDREQLQWRRLRRTGRRGADARRRTDDPPRATHATHRQRRLRALVRAVAGRRPRASVLRAGGR